MSNAPEDLSEDDEQQFIEAADHVTAAVEEMDGDLAFMACSVVMLDALEYMLCTYEDPSYPLMLANQVHVEFLTLMAEHGYDLSDTAKH